MVHAMVSVVNTPKKGGPVIVLLHWHLPEEWAEVLHELVRPDDHTSVPIAPSSCSYWREERPRGGHALGSEPRRFCKPSRLRTPAANRMLAASPVRGL